MKGTSKKKSRASKMKTFRDDWDNFIKEQIGEEGYREVKERAKIEIEKMRLKDLRKSLGITQDELKGIKQSEVSKIENRKDFKASTLAKYAKALGMKAKFVLESDDELIEIVI